MNTEIQTKHKLIDPEGGWPQPWSWGVFTISDAVEILGIPHRKILLYMEQEILVATVRLGGRGKANLLTISDLIALAVIRKLELFGVAPRKLREFLRDFLKGMLAGQSAVHMRMKRDPMLQIVPEDLDGGGDPVRTLKSYLSWLESDPFKVFVIGDEGDVTPVPVWKEDTTEKTATASMVDILAKHPSAVVVNVWHIAKELEAQIKKCAGK